MKSLVAALVLAATTVLSGCGTIDVLTGRAEPVAVDKQLPPQLRAAQAAVNEAEVALIAAHRDLRQNIADGVYNKKEATSYNNRLRSIGKDVDKIREMIRIGDLTAADKAELTKKLVVQLRREVVARSRRPQ